MTTLILEAIQQHKNTLIDHPFCQALRSPLSANKHAYGFIPHMAFFILGFKDMLKNLHVSSPQEEADKMLNAHCIEDSDHWQWFLEDLKTLQLGVDKWGGDIGSALQLIWADEDFPVRNLVYRVMHHVFQCRTTQEKLIIVECLEAAFAAFVVNLNHLTQRLGDYKKLKYFGEHHYVEESNHSMGSWFNESDKMLTAADTTKVVREGIMLATVDDIFAGFYQLFSLWNRVWVPDTIPEAV